MILQALADQVEFDCPEVEQFISFISLDSADINDGGLVWARSYG